MEKFKPSPEMIKAAETVFMAMAMVETIKPVVLKYSEEILAEGQWPVRSEFSERIGNEVILEKSKAWLMSDEHFLIYDGKCKEARKASDLYVASEDQCPLLVSEADLSKAETELADAMSPISPLNGEKINRMSPTMRKEVVELMLKLLAPFVSTNLSEIVQRAQRGGGEIKVASKVAESFSMTNEISALEVAYCEAASEYRSKQVGLQNHADELHKFIEIRDQLREHPDFSGHLPETFFSGGELDPDGPAPKSRSTRLRP